MRRRFMRSSIFFALLFTASCEDDALGPSSTVQSVAVIPNFFSLVAGDTLRLTTIARGDIGNPLVGRPVTWTTSSATVATISETGLVTAMAAGGAILTATIETKVGTATVAVSPRFPNAALASVAVGGAHTCALSVSGAAYCWGRGENGQLGVSPPSTTCLGDFTYPCGFVPLPVQGGLVFKQLALGGAHTCGLTSDGKAWCWGTNTWGELGDSSFTNRDTPVAVATAMKFDKIAAGNDHTCGLTDTGAAWCWGRNTDGQLGDGTSTTRKAPVRVGLPAGVVLKQIDGGGRYFDITCGLATTGSTYCWGSNNAGQLGQGTLDFTPHSTPVQVTGNHAFESISVGSDHVCGLTTAGAAYCWGLGVNGRLGDGTGLISRVPVAVSGGLVFAKLAAGGGEEGGHTCGLTTAGAAWCWGDNSIGALGDGTTTNERRVPVAVTGGYTFTSIESGYRHTCARTTAGTLYCWGSGRTGQLGIGSANSSRVPIKVIGQQ